jgi:gliding motility-associated-like protein
VRYFFSILILFLPVLCEAQLSAPGANAVRHTAYPSAPSVKDPIFIFCNASGLQKGSLNATSPRGTGPYNFTWYRWSDVTKTFSTLIKAETGVLASSASDLSEGGYKVSVGGGYDTAFVGWVFIDKPFSSAALQNFTCDYVALKGQAAVDTFYYRNISNGLPVKLPDGVNFLWSSNPASTIPYPDFTLTPQTFDPPLDDVTYNLQVTDSFGCISSSSFFYPTIRVKADFTAEPATGQAPMAVTITDKSIRASKYKWEFGDSAAASSTIKETFSSESPVPDPHTYYIPGEYYLKLTVSGKCVDSTKIKISVDPSALDIPNVFTPNGDGINDNFIVESKSLRSINVEVFSRSGLKVYSFFGAGDALQKWTGWDGNVNSTSVKASPGVYFYLIQADGWDNVVYKGKKYRGAVYLYR